MTVILEEDIGISPLQTGKQSNVSVYTVDGGETGLRMYNSQTTEVVTYVNTMNKLFTLGLPVKKPVNRGYLRQRMLRLDALLGK